MLYFCTRFREREQRSLDDLKRRACYYKLLVFFFPFAQRAAEKKKEKTSEIIWKIYNKLLTFASAFRKEKGKA